MPRWQYKVFIMDVPADNPPAVETAFNAIGAAGWEAFHIFPPASPSTERVGSGYVCRVASDLVTIVVWAKRPLP